MWSSPSSVLTPTEQLLTVNAVLTAAHDANAEGAGEHRGRGVEMIAAEGLEEFEGFSEYGEILSHFSQESILHVMAFFAAHCAEGSAEMWSSLRDMDRLSELDDPLDPMLYPEESGKKFPVDALRNRSSTMLSAHQPIAGRCCATSECSVYVSMRAVLRRLAEHITDFAEEPHRQRFRWGLSLIFAVMPSEPRAAFGTLSLLLNSYGEGELEKPQVSDYLYALRDLFDTTPSEDIERFSPEELIETVSRKLDILESFPDRKEEWSKALRFTEQSLLCAKDFFISHADDEKVDPWVYLNMMDTSSDLFGETKDEGGGRQRLQERLASMLTVHDAMSTECSKNSQCPSYRLIRGFINAVWELSVSSGFGVLSKRDTLEATHLLLDIVKPEPDVGFEMVIIFISCYITLRSTVLIDSEGYAPYPVDTPGFCSGGVLDMGTMTSHVHALRELLCAIPPAYREGIPAEVLVGMSVPK